MTTTPNIQDPDVQAIKSTGKSSVIVMGFAIVLIYAISFIGILSVSSQSHQQVTKAQIESKMSASAAFIALQSKVLVDSDDISGLRRVLLDTVSSSMMSHCEVHLADGHVIASTTPGAANEFEIDHRGSVLEASHIPTQMIWNQGDGSLTVIESIHSEVLGDLSVHATAGYDTLTTQSSARSTLVLIGGVGLLLILGVYRWFLNQNRAMTMIGGALESASKGERRAECLMVGEQLGEQAIVWNALLHERDIVEQRMIDYEITEISGAGVVESVGLPAACNTLTYGVVLVESDGRVIYSNGASAVLLRIQSEVLSDTHISDLPDHTELVELVEEALRSKIQLRKVIELGDTETIETDGTILKCVVSSVIDDSVSRALILIEDVTQQRLAEQSQGAFIAQATHELRTPLTTIRLYTEEAVEAGAEDEGVRDQALNTIQSEVRRLERIVGDMLCVSEIEAGSLSIRPEQTRTEGLFEDLRSDYTAQAKSKSIELVFDLPPKFPTINADRDRLGQALHNLLGNAIKYTPSGGRVEFRAEFEPNNAMIIQVIDDGIGIDESQQAKIFERFCRADDRRIAKVTGSGLGLSLARQIARLHGGDVIVESQIDQGSVFTLTIPGTQEMSQAA